jgi:hypothetical protein
MLWLSANGKCWFCGAYVPRDAMTVDHMVPVVRGGQPTLENLVVSCEHCNKAKAGMSLEEYRAGLGTQTIFWGEHGEHGTPRRAHSQSVRTLIVASMALVVLGMHTDVSAQIVRYKAHGQSIFVAPASDTSHHAALCGAVGRLAATVVKALDGGVSLAKILAVMHEDESVPFIAMLYSTPAVTPAAAQHIAEFGCLHGQAWVLSDSQGRAKAVAR